MTDLKSLLEQYGSGRTEENAIEALVVSVQLALQRAMSANCVSQKQLAERLGLSGARVSQILSADGANLTLKTIARVAFALNEEFEFVSQNDAKSIFESQKHDMGSQSKREAEDFILTLPARRIKTASRQVKWSGSENHNSNSAPAGRPTRMVA
jgi:transcriptional regulator with XRE-family HTH domain